MRKIIVFILISLFPAQLFAGSLSLELGKRRAKAGAGYDEGLEVASLGELSRGSSLSSRNVIAYEIGSLDDGAPFLSAAGYSGGLLKKEAESGYSQADDFGLNGGYTPASVAIRSFLLPGLGQRYMGKSVRSKIYFALEGAAWIGLGAFYWQSIARKNAYEDYAMAYAGVSGTGKPDDYYEIIGNFFSNEGPGGYNEFIMREARDLYYPDLEAIEAYYQSNIITGSDSWRWESRTSYDRFNDLRKGSNAAERRVIYTLFYMLGIRVISAVDAARSAMGSESGVDTRNQSSNDLILEQNGSGISLIFNRSF